MKKNKLARTIGFVPFQLFLIFFICFNTLAGHATEEITNKTVMGKQMTIHLKNKKVKDVFEYIEKNSEFIFFYSKDAIDLNRLVNISYTNRPINEILDNLFKGTHIKYDINDRQISLKRDNSGINNPIPQQDNGFKVQGVIKDSKGEPIIGANIMVKGTKMGTTSDINGQFAFYVPSGKSILVVTYIGFKNAEVAINNNRNVEVVIHEDSESLEEVVVVGYGRQKKESVVSSINTVTTKELKVPTRNLTNSLAGQIAGLIAVQRTGEPGYDNSEFWIRGVSSFKGGTNPLVLVDGVPRNMADIEPDEIDTFTLLKDAAATAVYGAEGANGVIIITSKRGMAQKPRISFRAELSNIEPTRLPKFLGSADFLNLYNEALGNEGREPVYSEDLIQKYASGEDPDLYPDTNWLDLLRKNTSSHRYTLNIRGGSEKTRYFVSGAYYTEDGIFKSNPGEDYSTNIGVERYNLRSNIDLNISKTTILNVDMSGQYLLTNYPGTGTATIFKSMLTTPPFLMPMKYSDGTLAGHPRPSSNRANPYNRLMESGYAKEWRTSIQSKVGLDQKLDFILKGLSARANISFDANMFFNSKRTKTPSQFQATGRDENGKLIFKEVVQGSDNLTESKGNNGDKRIYFESAINYNNTFGDHKVGAMALYMQKEQQYHDNALAFRKQGVVSRITYSYTDRYFLEGSFGYTGSETFAKGYRFGFFPAGGVAWLITNEPFFPQGVKNIMPKLKLRASLGRTGNDNTGGNRFMYRGTLNQSAGGYDIGITSGASTNGVGSGIVEAQFEAPYLSWEIETKQNYGIDLGFFDNRIDIMVDYFSNRRYNILLQRQTVSNVTGFQQMPWQNFGEVTNKGFDGSIVLNQQIGDLKLSARGNVTFARNKIIEYDEVTQKYPWMEVTGKRLNRWNLYIAEGLYEYDDFIIEGEGLKRTYTLKEGIVKSGLSNDIKPGDIKYKDINGDGIIDSFDQLQDVGNPSTPELVYGFGVNAEYKGIYAGIFFQGAGNTSTVLGANTSEGFFPFQWGFDETSIRREALNRWTDDNPSQNVMFPRLRTNSHPHNTAPSTWWMRDASFLRLKNIEVGYNFQKRTLRKMGIEAMRIYLLGNNLAVWDKIKMWDPEIGNNNAGFNYPLPRTFTLGLDFTF